MEFKDFYGTFISYNKRIYKKLIILTILLFYFLFLIYYNYFSVILGNEIGVSWVYGILFALITTVVSVMLLDLLRVFLILRSEREK
ncbi:MAG: hypothetical protein R3255_05690 [Candidatus Lokiarchaeia archaeon]|nr:hypothetical protein [Candidatus Lokiarchaeia archaeon]